MKFFKEKTDNYKEDQEIFFGIMAIFLALFALVPTFMILNRFQENLEGVFYGQISKPFQQIAMANVAARPEKPSLDMDAGAALSLKIYKYGKEKILYRKDSDKILPIASLTKLMTGLIVVDNNAQNDYDFSRIVTVSSESANKENVPVYGNLKEGESFTIKKLLEIMMIYSSNDAAFSLSEVMGRDNFVSRMNQKAKILGLENTLFVNPTGLDPEGNNQAINHSSAQELVDLAKYILNRYPSLFELSVKPGPYETLNGISDLSLPKELKLVGGKTGYTDNAGGCMMVILEDERENLIVNVILGTESSAQRVQEMQKMINWVNSL